MTIDLFTYGFMQRALLVGILIAVSCAIIGVFLILRRTAFIGEGLAHISFAGVALGFLFGVEPLVAALFVTIFGALAIAFTKEKSLLFTDTIIGIFSYTGFALGILLVSMQSVNVELFGYLFGNILAVSYFDMVFSGLLALLVVGFVMYFYYDLYYITFDEETAKSAGIKVEMLNYLFALLVAVCVVISMRIVGIILVASFMILPAASAMHLTKTFRKMVALSIIISVFSALMGLVAAFYLDTAAGATIVLLNFLIFAVSFSREHIL